tara:strand:+ start:988 stop:1230 length:243 start_codon:yes stop_codon:yes gene_type:complete
MEDYTVSSVCQPLTRPIPIKKNKGSPSNTISQTEYSLKQNFFDPTKSSPPDNFMDKLELRMQHYYNNLSPCTIDAIVKTA